MVRYRGPKLRMVRRLGNLPGLTQKQSKKINRPGRPGQDTKSNADTNKKITEYGLRLEEKQKLRFNYGITESQLYRYIKEARRRKGITGLILLQLLEMRLDSIIFALGFSPTMGAARQLVNHGHITVNEKIIDIPSFQCRLNDKIGVKQKSNSLDLVKKNLEVTRFNELPSHLILEKSILEATVTNYCDREDILLDLDELLVIEYYSRR